MARSNHANGLSRSASANDARYLVSWTTSTASRGYGGGKTGGG